MTTPLKDLKQRVVDAAMNWNAVAAQQFGPGTHEPLTREQSLAFAETMDGREANTRLAEARLDLDQAFEDIALGLRPAE